MIVGLLSGQGIFSPRPDSSHRLVTVQECNEGELRIIDHENGRHLLVNGDIRGLVDTSTWDSYMHSCAVMDLPKLFFIQPGKMLLIGVNTGSLIKQYYADRWTVDAIESDPTIVRVAREYFHLTDGEGKVYQTNGRKYLQMIDQKYDVILLDEFRHCEPQPNLITKEAFSLIASHLTDQGLFAMNIITAGWHDSLVTLLTTTLRQQFKEVLVLPMEEPPDDAGNIILLAGNRHLQPFFEPLSNLTLDPDWRYGAGYQKVHAWDNRFIDDPKSTQIITDDQNPTDRHIDRINRAVRNQLHQYYTQLGIAELVY
jgi:spermidine synthase